jgi:hypothetical protein
MSVTRSEHSCILWLVTGLSCLILTLQGCSEKGGGTRFGNVAPETFITVGPKEESCNYYKVRAYWYGTDLDGRIEGFEVAVIPDTAIALLADGDYEDLAWVHTVSSESTFVLTGDSCCVPDHDLWYGLSSWALLVRAVDNERARDPEPAVLLFQTCNVVPKVRITIPSLYTPDCLSFPPHPYIEWRGQDPDGDTEKLMYKYIVIPEKDLNSSIPRLPPLDMVDTAAVSYSAPGIGYWSEWVPADCTYVTDLDLSAWAGLGLEAVLRMYVTVKDEGGAILPENLYRIYSGSRNWLRFVVMPGVASSLQTVIDGGILGRRWSFGTTHYETTITSMFSGPEISFRFWAEETHNTWEVAEAYRYYFDYADDPSSSTWDRWILVEPLRQTDRWPEWIVRFPADVTSLSPEPGRHVFVVEVRDLNDLTSHCEFHIDILESPRGRPHSIYLVDDNVNDGLWESYLWHEQGEDSLWAEILAGYNYDVFDTGPDFENRVSARPISYATTLIWAVGDDIVQDTQLLRLCTKYGNFLHSYVKSGGNLIIIGLNAIIAHAFWPDDRWLPHERATTTSYDFRPPDIIGRDTTVNFNWDILGMETAAILGKQFRTICPCEEGWPPIEARPVPGHPDWDGTFVRAFVVTGVRSDIDVHTLYGPVPLDSGGQPEEPDCGRWLAVYVPGDETRGHAAYVGFPPYLCDPDQIKTMVRHLLDLFGEQPVNP